MKKKKQSLPEAVECFAANMLAWANSLSTGEDTPQEFENWLIGELRQFGIRSSSSSLSRKPIVAPNLSQSTLEQRVHRKCFVHSMLDDANLLVAAFRIY